MENLRIKISWNYLSLRFESNHSSTVFVRKLNFLSFPVLVFLILSGIKVDEKKHFLLPNGLIISTYNPYFAYTHLIEIEVFLVLPLKS
jgi:hypothetical protein